MTYSQASKELEEIVTKLQNPACEVDELCSLTARALELVKFCKEKLTQTDEELSRLLDGIE